MVGYVPPVTIVLCLKHFLGDEVRSPEGDEEKRVPWLGESVHRKLLSTVTVMCVMHHGQVHGSRKVIPLDPKVRVTCAPEPETSQVQRKKWQIQQQIADLLPEPQPRLLRKDLRGARADMASRTLASDLRQLLSAHGAGGCTDPVDGEDQAEAADGENHILWFGHSFIGYGGK